MPWVYLDDHIDEHDKVIAAGDAAFGLWVRCLAYSRRKLSGGRVPKSWPGVKGERTKTQRLITVGLLEDCGEHFQIHDYERWNHSEEKSRKARQSARARWENANASETHVQSQSERNADADAHARAPASVPLTPSLSKSSPTDTFVGHPVVGEVLSRIADREVTAARQAGTLPRSEAGFRKHKLAEAQARYGDTAQRIATEDPSVTARELDGILTNPAVANGYYARRAG